MLVTCKICKTKIDKNNAYNVIINNKNNYYCNKDEYDHLTTENESRLKVIDYAFEIIGKTTNTSLMKELSGIAKIHTYSKILKYIEMNVIDLSIIMDKEFNSEYGKIKYFTSIIKNSIGDFSEKVESNDMSDSEVIENVKYKPTPMKTFFDYINEY